MDRVLSHLGVRVLLRRKHELADTLHAGQENLDVHLYGRQQHQRRQEKRTMNYVHLRRCVYK